MTAYLGLRCHYFDFSSYAQADCFVTTTKDITEHVGRTYTNCGDIWTVVETKKMMVVPKPRDPALDHADIIDSSDTVVTTSRSQVDAFNLQISNQKINIYVKLKATLVTNIQKAYSVNVPNS